jgi:hypothetical protein
LTVKIGNWGSKIPVNQGIFAVGVTEFENQNSLGLWQSPHYVIAMSGFCDEAIPKLLEDCFAPLAMTRQRDFDKALYGYTEFRPKSD